jgi:hypothetical protein
MMKRMIPLLALVVVFCLFAAPDASASCRRCSGGQCVYVYHPAWHYCAPNPAMNWCFLEDECDPWGAAKASTAPLAAEYRVEAVEVLDDAAPAEEAQSAKLEADFEQKID